MKYRLEVSVSIDQIEDDGRYTGGRLQIREQETLELDGFMEVARALSSFHDLVGSMRIYCGPKKP